MTHHQYISLEKIETATNDLLRAIGEDPAREGLKGTPKRVARAWAELTSGYGEKPEEVLGTVFSPEGYDQVVALRDVPFVSLCEHHLLPFHGEVDIAYLPGKHVVGISKLARIVQTYARRLQIQERMTAQIAEAIHTILKPKGVVVRVVGEHSCMRMRGTKVLGSSMVTSDVRGTFRTKAAARAEVFALFDREG